MGRRFAFGLVVTVLVLAAAACSDDESGGGDTGGGGVADQGGDGDSGGDGGADADATDGGGDGSSDVADQTDEVVERTCGRPAAQDEAVTYDVLSPLAEFAGEALVTRDGLDVSVVIPDDNGGEPTTFEGAFTAGTRCVDATYENIAASLCFFNADGTPAVAESLGAQIFAFIQGGQTDTPNATLLGGVRRELDLSCSMAGFYQLDVSGLTEDGDLPAEVAPAVEDELLGYLALLEVGGGRIHTAVGAAPVVEPALSADVESGAVEVDIEAGLDVTIGEADVAYDLLIAFDGSVDFESGEISGTMTVTITGDADAGTLAGTVTGQRG